MTTRERMETVVHPGCWAGRRQAGLILATAAVAAAAAPGARAAQATVADALAVQPRQADVACDRPTPAEVDKATIKQEKIDGVAALVVRAGTGEVLRAFADTNGNRVVDRWSFFKDGIEVYRDIDSDHDTKVDQSRWLNAGGSRWCLDADADGAPEGWRVISAEEATAEVVRALRGRDPAVFARLLPSPADLEAAGFSGERLAALTARVQKAGADFRALAAKQRQIGSAAVWQSMLTPNPPGVLPAGAPGITADVTAYDNVVALVENAGADGRGTGQIYIGSLVRCGDTWRPIDAPQVMGEAGEIADSVGFFSPQFGLAAAGGGAMDDDRIKPLVAKLQEVEARMLRGGADRGQAAAEQVALLEQIRAGSSDGDRGFWTRQLVETLAAYVQESLLPEGTAMLEALAAEAANDDTLGAFIAFRLAQARYSAEMQQPGAEGEKLQNRWFEELAAFVERYPQAPESAEAMLQLGFRDEFENREQEAVERYRAVVAAFPDTSQARKAGGAVRRLESVGKPFVLSGTTVDGRAMSSESVRGVPLLIHYWSTDCEPCKVDLARIRELHDRYGPKRLAVVGVALDGEKSRLTEYLAAKPLPWPQLHEPGGLDSRLAEEFGVLALPTMLLVDKNGKVIDRNVAITDLEKKLESLVGGK
jgi:thiol-disulfide isomerase/thioredoxin